MRQKIYAVACIALLIAPVPAHSAEKAAANGDQLLSRAVNAPRLRSYSVPLHFTVRLRKPLPVRTRVEATAYYLAPAQAALVITRASGLAGSFFRGGYKLDVVPQSWPAAYRVTSVERGTDAGAPVVFLHAQRRTEPGDLTGAVFTVTTAPPAAIAAEWQYGDGSSVRLRFENRRTAAYTLPAHAAITVDKPSYRLEADAAYGDYAFNVPISPDVFASAK
jgi:hypothetical protein